MVIVYVWKRSPVSEMGHSSMICRVGDATKKFYVSWYPTQDVGIAAVLGKEYCVPGRAYQSLKQEVAKEWKGKQPDLAVTIKHLNEDRMETGWKELFEQGQWCLARLNCATVVYQLLREGYAPSEEKINDFAKAYESRHGDMAWIEEDHLKDRLALEVKNAWTPIRVYNYAVRLVQYYKSVDQLHPKIGPAPKAKSQGSGIRTQGPAR